MNQFSVTATAAVAVVSIFMSNAALAGERDKPSAESAAGAELADSQSVSSSREANQNAIEDYFDHWFDRVREAQAGQPHWMTPVATVTPRLEEEVRYDQFWEHLGTGANLDVFDGGKGLELIPTTTNEVLINAPPYEERHIKRPATGWGDWPFLTVKQRLLSAPEDKGNYILSAFLGLQAPTGDAAFTNRAWIVTPTLAGGVGWGNFDIQATFGIPVPLAHEDTIGTAIVTNLALQYHVAEYFWPEFEFNNTYWTDGPRGGKNQLFVTPGLILGRFPIYGRARFIIGAGYQIAVTPKLTTTPVLTPVYNHAWILTARLAF